MDELKIKLSPEAFQNLQTWLTKPEYKDFVADINQLISEKNLQELEDAFYKHIEIGTGGIRGPIGPGPNRINLRTIGEAAQGLAHFIEDFGPEAKAKGVVVGHEARKLSRPFAEACCSIFAANGIKSYLFDSLRATPEVSFAVRFLKSVAGVQLTASHNPRTDNGFKFYWTDGGQVVPPADQKFMQLVSNVTEIKTMEFEDALGLGFVKLIGEEVDEEYFKALRGLSLVKNRSAQIVFSPIHGAGSTNVLPILEAEGFKLDEVFEQSLPDEEFPTAVGDLINPEYPEVMGIVIRQAEKTSADLAICSDPDADRLGVAVKEKLTENKMKFLTGNEIGIVQAKFVLDQLKQQGKLKSNSLVLETYVTTSLISEIAKSYGVKVVDDLLVGFKYIGEIIEKLEDKNDFTFAAEESHGYLRGSFVRDKDAAIAALTVAEATSFLKDQNKTVADYLDEIYKEFGYYKNILHSIEMRGREGFENRDKIMKNLRAKPPSMLAGMKVLKIIDRLPEEKRRPENYKCGATGDQITFVLSEDEKTRVTARPSGTEPKIKYYIQHTKKEGNLEEIKNEVDEVVKKLDDDIIKIQEGVLG